VASSAPVISLQITYDVHGGLINLHDREGWIAAT
jgi:hypothetical protein